MAIKRRIDWAGYINIGTKDKPEFAVMGTGFTEQGILPAPRQAKSAM